jgi:hypothetical protein
MYSDDSLPLASEWNRSLYAEAGVEIETIERVGQLRGTRAGGDDRYPRIIYNGERTSLFHYSDDTGIAGIIESQNLRKSTGYEHARYGDGVYLSDVAPESIVARTKHDLTPAERKSGKLTIDNVATFFYGRSNLTNSEKIMNFVEIDITGLKVRQGLTKTGDDFRTGVQFILTDTNLDLNGRIIRKGKTL